MDIVVTYNLRAIRKSKKLTIEALSKLSGVGVATISDIENGKIHPTMLTMCSLEYALKVDIKKLYNCTKKNNFRFTEKM